MKTLEPVLCYVKGGLAYFTTQALELQGGDDWNDTPYETNASPPSIAREKQENWKILVYAYNGTKLETPAEISGGYTAYSVEDINAGAVAWLYGTTKDGRKIAIYAGETLEGFKKIIKQAGGTLVRLGEDAS